MRVKRGNVLRKRHKKILKLAKGFIGARSRIFKVANIAVMKKLKYQYRDRRVLKRNMRSLWIVRINAAVREMGLSYSKFMNMSHSNRIKAARNDRVSDFHVHASSSVGFSRKWVIKIRPYLAVLVIVYFSRTASSPSKISGDSDSTRIFVRSSAAPDTARRFMTSPWMRNYQNYVKIWRKEQGYFRS